jgi:hypothetical protein
VPKSKGNEEVGSGGEVVGKVLLPARGAVHRSAIGGEDSLAAGIWWARESLG